MRSSIRKRKPRTKTFGQRSVCAAIQLNNKLLTLFQLAPYHFAPLLLFIITSAGLTILSKGKANGRRLKITCYNSEICFPESICYAKSVTGLLITMASSGKRSASRSVVWLPTVVIDIEITWPTKISANLVRNVCHNLKLF